MFYTKREQDRQYGLPCFCVYFVLITKRHFVHRKQLLWNGFPRYSYEDLINHILILLVMDIIYIKSRCLSTRGRTFHIGNTFPPNAFGIQSLWYGRLFRIIYSLLIIFSQKAHVKQSLCSVWPYHGQDMHNLFLDQNWADACPRNSEPDGEFYQYFVFWIVCSIFYEKYSSRLTLFRFNDNCYDSQSNWL